MSKTIISTSVIIRLFILLVVLLSIVVLQKILFVKTIKKPENFQNFNPSVSTDSYNSTVWNEKNTFSNEKINITFEYPKIYSVDYVKNGIGLFQDSKYYSDIFIIASSTPMVLQLHGAFYPSTRPGTLNQNAPIRLMSTEKIAINSIIWTKEIWDLQSTLKSINYHTIYRGVYYTFSIGIENDDEMAEKNMIAEQILSTFRFLM